MSGRGRGRRAANDGDANRWGQMMQMMQQQQTLSTNILNHLTNIAGNAQHAPPPPPPPQQGGHGAFQEFFKMKPPSFKGSIVPLEAHGWLKEMEKIFRVVPCTEGEKVTFAVHMLKGAAEAWWEGASAYMVTNNLPLDWEHFQTVFLEKYFPNSVRIQKEQEFHHLKQGSMSMNEYVAKFEELARFSSQALYAPDDQWKMNQFKWGIKESLDQKSSKRPQKRLD